MKLFEKIAIPVLSLCIVGLGVIFFLFVQSQGTRLIVQGDDMGFCHSVNVGCIRSYQEGIMTTVEVMVPGPFFLEAADMLNENPGLDVGVHLTLTSEWEKLKWGPLTDVPSLVDDKGHFFPMVWPNEAYPEDRALGSAEWKLDEIEKELRAQIETALENIPHCSHMTPHMAFHEISPAVSALFMRLAREYNLDANLRILPIRFLHLLGYGYTPEEKIANAIKTLQNLKTGTWQVVEHPGLDTPEMRGIWHIGDEDVAFQRDGVTKALTDERVKQIIKERRIKLIGYRDLKLWH